MEAQLLQTRPKEEVGGGGGGAAAQMERKTVVTAGGVQEKHLDLRLGISRNGFGDTGSGSSGSGGPVGAKGVGGQLFAGAATGILFGGGVPPQPARVCSGFGAKRWFPETVGRFVNPWSLAARQETAVLEQRTLAFCGNVTPHSVPRAPSTPSPVVGWPPVRAFRKNLVAPLHPNPEMDGQKDSKKTKSSDGHTPRKLDVKQPTMFVKVNMEGYNVGRKIDLMAHSSYKSLSCALQKMFHNFLAVNSPNDTGPSAQDKPMPANYVLLYEDNEGDRMLVGDVPWEMFMSSVKRLYIVSGSRDPKRVDDRAEDGNKSKQFEHEAKAEG